MGFQMFGGKKAVRRRCAMVSLRLKESGNDFTNSFFVIDNQDVFGWHWACRPKLLYGKAHASKRAIVHL
jgi:hypothetical protein